MSCILSGESAGVFVENGSMEPFDAREPTRVGQAGSRKLSIFMGDVRQELQVSLLRFRTSPTWKGGCEAAVEPGQGWANSRSATKAR